MTAGHPRVAVIGSVALVGSSNFTVPGLTQNVELNIQIRAPGDVSQLQAWYEQHWQEAEEITPDVIKVIQRHIDEYTPFDVHAKALQELFEHHTPSEAEWENGESKIYAVLDHYQKEGYHSLLSIARQFNGGFLCDGVGLGKTFVGLMLIERLVMRDKKRVVLLVPKSGRVAVWERNIRHYLPHLLNGFLPFKIYNHTDLMRGPSADGRDFPSEFQQIKEQAAVVLIDEAHHFRNRGLANAEDGTIRSRYWQLYDILGKKTLFMLTATPVNNALTDFQHQIELFSPLEQMHLEFQKLLADTPGLQQRLDQLPGRVFSGKEHPKPGTRALFLCYALPAEDKTQRSAGVPPASAAGVSPASASEDANWSTEAGKAGWYMYDLATGKILEQPEEIVAFIRSTPETPRRVALPQTDLHDVRLKVEKHIKNTYLKQVQAPVGVNPVLQCWMELN